MAQQGTGMLSQGISGIGNAGWHPTVLYLLAFIVAEMIVFGLLSKVLR